MTHRNYRFLKGFDRDYLCTNEIEHDVAVTHWDDYQPCEIPSRYSGQVVGIKEKNYRHMKSSMT
ncbi:MAG: hypothetical protein ACQEW9_04990 [Bacteroidota bacterium]